MGKSEAKDKKNDATSIAEETTQTPEQEAANPEASTEKSNDETSCSRDEQLLKQLDEATAKADEYQQQYLRSVADLENFRKRVAREREELRKFAVSGLIEDILPALDNLDLGLQSAQQHHPEAKAVLDGIDMVQTQLKNILKEHGTEAIAPAAGEEFDPNSHECVSHIEHEEIEEDKIISVSRIGYRLNGRLIRPAMVIVSNGQAKEEKN